MTAHAVLHADRSHDARHGTVHSASAAEQECMHGCHRLQDALRSWEDDAAQAHVAARSHARAIQLPRAPRRDSCASCADRMVPSLMIIGSIKTGTTQLWSQLVENSGGAVNPGKSTDKGDISRKVRAARRAASRVPSIATIAGEGFFWRPIHVATWSCLV